MADRVVVFLDYQNVYMGARACFHSRIEPHWCGQIDPLKLGLHLAADSPFDREHVGVRAYRGLPDGTFDPKGFGACTRQCAIWEQDSRVSAILRPLSYPRGVAEQPQARREAAREGD